MFLATETLKQERRFCKPPNVELREVVSSFIHEGIGCNIKITILGTFFTISETFLLLLWKLSLVSFTDAPSSVVIS
jgi:hypothetical protein